MPAMTAEELHHSALTLKRRNVHVQIHPINALHLERDVLIQDFGYSLWYGQFRLRYGSDPSGSTATSVAISLAGTACSPSPSTGAISSIIGNAQPAPKIHLVGLRRSLVSHWPRSRQWSWRNRLNSGSVDTVFGVPRVRDQHTKVHGDPARIQPTPKAVRILPV
jgi:hypothetical protein